jgi:uncharacterized C2H2 Zn-finger protein
MGKHKPISLDDVNKADVAICPNCGTIFVKSIKGPDWAFLGGTKIRCPVCDEFVARKEN